MTNINKKKFVRRLAKSPNKQYPLVNLYIIILVVFQCLCELLEWVWPQVFLKVTIMVLMIYYIHNKTTHMDYLVANLAKFGLILHLVSDLIAMTEQELSSMFCKVFRIIGLALYCLAFRIPQPIGYTNKWQVAGMTFLGALVVGMHVAKIKVYEQQYLYSDFKAVDYLFEIANAALVVVSLFRYKMSSPRSFAFVWIGSVCLVGSVFLTATFKHFTIFWRTTDTLVVLAYYTGHYLLMHGAILHCNLQEAIEKFRSRPLN